MSEIVEFPATAADTLIEGYCNDFIQLAASLAQTLEQITMRKLELGESRDSLVRVERGMRSLADAIAAHLEATKAGRKPRRSSEPPMLGDRQPLSGAKPSVPSAEPAPAAPSQAPPGSKLPTRDCIIQGNTDSMPMTSVFQFLSRMRKSGKLVVALENEQLTLELVDGCVEGVRSNRPPKGERVGELLVDRGYVRPEQIAAITKGKRYTVRELGTQLVRARQITLAQLRSVLRTQAQRRLQRVMQARSAKYEFHEGRRDTGPDHMQIRVPLQPSADKKSKD